MNVVLINKAKTIYANGIFEPLTKSLVLKAGATISGNVSHTPTFKAGDRIEKMRAKYVENGVTKEDIFFKSPSAAANFVTGRSCNGYLTWKTEEGITLKKALYRSSQL